MHFLASTLCLFFGCLMALTGYIAGRIASPATSEDDFQVLKKGLRTGCVFIGTTVTALAIIAITDIARPSFNSLVFAVAGSTVGLAFVTVGLVRQRRLPAPQTDEDHSTPSE